MTRFSFFQICEQNWFSSDFGIEGNEGSWIDHVQGLWKIFAAKYDFGYPHNEEAQVLMETILGLMPLRTSAGIVANIGARQEIWGLLLQSFFSG